MRYPSLSQDDSPIRWEDMLLSRHGRSRVVVEDGNAPASGPAPRKAVLHGKVTEHIGKKISIMEIDLRTGRLHQIRVQVQHTNRHFVKFIHSVIHVESIQGKG